MTRAVFLFAALLFAAASPAYAQEARVVSLREALKLASDKNPDLASAKAQVDAVWAQTNRVWGAVLPELSVTGSLVHTSAPAELDLGGFVQLVGGVYGLMPLQPPLVELPPPVSIVAKNSAYATVQVSQLIFTPQVLMISAIDPAREAADYGGKEAKEQVLLGVARVYLGLQGVEQLGQAASDAEQVALKREKDAKAQMAAGMAVEVAVLRAQTETAQARSVLAQLQGQKYALTAMLESLTGSPIRPEPFAPKDDWGQPGDDAQVPWESVPLVKAAQKQTEVQEVTLRADYFSWLPSVVAMAKGGYNSNAGFSGTNLSYDFVLALNWTIYDRGERWARTRENEAKLRGLEASSAAARAKAKANWVAAKANLQAAKAALEQAESQAQLATRAQKQVEAAFAAGVSTSLELSDIDSKRFLAQSSAAQARAQLEIRKVEMAAAEGRLAMTAGL
ncbi:MAG: TolC family protein [Myxococcaceae bacterium]|nr:TolC family protein [Myxococcaceae bacterium]